MGKTLAWMFVWLVTFLDVGFAWYWRDCFSEWELNPLARTVYALGGMEAVLAYRLACLGLVTALFFWIEICRKECVRPWLMLLFVAVWVSGHLYLLGAYILFFLGVVK